MSKEDLETEASRKGRKMLRKDYRKVRAKRTGSWIKNTTFERKKKSTKLPSYQVCINQFLMEKNSFLCNHLLHRGCDISSDFHIVKTRDKIVFVGESRFIGNIQVFITWRTRTRQTLLFLDCLRVKSANLYWNEGKISVFCVYSAIGNLANKQQQKSEAIINFRENKKLYVVLFSVLYLSWPQAVDLCRLHDSGSFIFWLLTGFSQYDICHCYQC